MAVWALRGCTCVCICSYGIWLVRRCTSVLTIARRQVVDSAASLQLTARWVEPHMLVKGLLAGRGPQRAPHLDGLLGLLLWGSPVRHVLVFSLHEALARHHHPPLYVADGALGAGSALLPRFGHCDTCHGRSARCQETRM